jgi:hypothetical protein
MMRDKIPYKRFALLLLGIAMVWVSPLFYAVDGSLYVMLLWVGIMLSTVILFALLENRWRPFLLGIVSAAVSAGLYLASDRFLINASFELAVWIHQAKLEQAASILHRVKQDRGMIFSRDSCLPGMTTIDCEALRTILADINAAAHPMSDSSVAFSLFEAGRFQGVVYSPNATQDKMEPRKHLMGNWYRWP